MTTTAPSSSPSSHPIPSLAVTKDSWPVSYTHPSEEETDEENAKKSPFPSTCSTCLQNCLPQSWISRVPRRYMPKTELITEPEAMTELMKYLCLSTTLLPAPLVKNADELHVEDSRRLFMQEEEENNNNNTTSGSTADAFWSSNHNGEEQEEESPFTAPLPTFEPLLAAAIKKVNGGHNSSSNNSDYNKPFFLKMNGKAPADASWVIAAGSGGSSGFDLSTAGGGGGLGSVRATCVSQVYELLVSSDAVRESIRAVDRLLITKSASTTHPSSSSSSSSPQQPPQQQHSLLIQRWNPPPHAGEFRVFVHRKRIVGISQRHITECFPHLNAPEAQSFVRKTLYDFCKDVVMAQILNSASSSPPPPRRKEEITPVVSSSSASNAEEKTQKDDSQSTYVFDCCIWGKIPSSSPAAAREEDTGDEETSTSLSDSVSAAPPVKITLLDISPADTSADTLLFSRKELFGTLKEAQNEANDEEDQDEGERQRLSVPCEHVQYTENNSTMQACIISDKSAAQAVDRSNTRVNSNDDDEDYDIDDESYQTTIPVRVVLSDPPSSSSSSSSDTTSTTASTSNKTSKTIPALDSMKIRFHPLAAHGLPDEVFELAVAKIEAATRTAADAMGRLQGGGGGGGGKERSGDSGVSGVSGSGNTGQTSLQRRPKDVTELAALLEGVSSPANTTSHGDDTTATTSSSPSGMGPSGGMGNGWEGMIEQMQALGMFRKPGEESDSEDDDD